LITYWQPELLDAALAAGFRIAERDRYAGHLVVRTCSPARPLD
jgi:hypothetical protein